jgi:hypothetical protein
MGPGLVLEAKANRLTVFFDKYGYSELAAQVVLRTTELTDAHVPGVSRWLNNLQASGSGK